MPGPLESAAQTQKPALAPDELCINTIRTLSMDAVQKANSGHPGTPMALAPVAYTIWQQFLRYDPQHPAWPNRDRFVLSNGHASMLLYSLIHLAGVKDGAGPALSLDEIKRFRQIDSKTPGHPEHGLTVGVETTTGPLGQGCGNSVGMAIASRWLATHLNKPGFTLFDYDVYTLCGDGDMMEGVASEAASMAGHLKLANLCWIYDNNGITIEGHTSLAFDEDVGARFRAYGWHVEHVKDANDREALAKALADFNSRTDAPTMIVVDSHIGYGSPNRQDTAAAHGEALGADEVRLTKQRYGWPPDAQFLVPDGVRERFDEGIGRRGAQYRQQWTKLLDGYRAQYPAEAQALERLLAGELPDGWDAAVPSFPADAKGLATRDSSAKVVNAIAEHYPALVSGSADLAPSTKTRFTFKGAGDLEPDNHGGRTMHYGIREHAMGAIVNGLNLSGVRAFGSTFLIFSDYMKNSIRLSALMDLPVIHVFTHDSIGLGEDGPTHQSIEQLPGLRAIPGMLVLRPGDANEVAEAWKIAIQQKKRPTLLVLSRQAVPTLDRSRYAPAAGVARGAYVLADAKPGRPEVILIGTGTELSLCIEAYEALKGEGIAARLVSMPSWELFEAQDGAYRESVLPSAVTARVSVEAASPIGWDRYVGRDGARIAMYSFGASAPYKDVYKKFGFTPEKIIAAAKDQLAKGSTR
jgi:transketolase